MRSRLDAATSDVSRKRKWIDPGDELVPIIAERLEAALQHRRMNPHSLAEKLGEKPQTIDLIVTGKTKRPRRFRLEAIAKVLRVPAEWLSGEMKFLPYVVPPRRRVEADGQVTFDDDEEAASKPSLLQLAESEFFTACHRAIDRDMMETWPDPVEVRPAGRRVFGCSASFCVTSFDRDTGIEPCSGHQRT